MADTITVRVSGSEVEVGDGTVIGRSRSADLSIDDSFVSREHARINHGPEGWFLIDLDSANGVFGPAGETRFLRLPPGETELWLGPPDAGCLIEVVVPVPHDYTEAQTALIERPSNGEASAPAPAPGGAPNDLANARTVRAQQDGPPPPNQPQYSGPAISHPAAPQPPQPPMTSHPATYTVAALDPSPGGFGMPGAGAGSGATQGFSVRADGLTVRVDGDLMILDDVSLALPAGTLTAIIGPSGCGKSTLASLLTGRRRPSSGTVTIDGEPMSEPLRNRVGVVPQHDAVHERLTVRQALRSAAKLRLPPNTPKAVINEAVKRTATTLGLDQRLNTRAAKMSGGQKKRLSVGYELVSNPAMMVLDEPTSGLDPGTEQELITELRAMADRGTTTIVITHSPQAAEQADLVIVMAPGGHLAFVGPPADVLQYFDAGGWGTVFNKLKDADGEKWANYFSGTTAYYYHLAYQPPPKNAYQAAAPVQRSWASDFGVMLGRYARTIIADPKSLLLLALQAPVLGFMFAWVLSINVFGPRLRPATAAREFVLAVVLAMVWIGASNSIREIVKERTTFLRERAVGVSASSLVASRWVVLSVITIIQATVLYLAASSRQQENSVPEGVLIPNGNLELIVALALVGLASVGLGLVLSGAVKDSNKAMAVLPILLIPVILFSGLLIPTAGKPGLEQLSYVDPVQWGSSAAAVTADVLENEGCNPTGLEAQIQQAVLGRTISCSSPRWQTTASAQTVNFGFALVVLAVLVALSFWVTSRSTDDDG